MHVQANLPDLQNLHLWAGKMNFRHLRSWEISLQGCWHNSWIRLNLLHRSEQLRFRLHLRVKLSMLLTKYTKLHQAPLDFSGQDSPDFQVYPKWEFWSSIFEPRFLVCNLYKIMVAGKSMDWLAHQVSPLVQLQPSFDSICKTIWTATIECC